MKEAHYKAHPDWRWSSKEKKRSRSTSGVKTPVKDQTAGTFYVFLNVCLALSVPMFQSRPSIDLKGVSSPNFCRNGDFAVVLKTMPHRLFFFFQDESVI